MRVNISCMCTSCGCEMVSHSVLVCCTGDSMVVKRIQIVESEATIYLAWAIRHRGNDAAWPTPGPQGCQTACALSGRIDRYGDTRSEAAASLDEEVAYFMYDLGTAVAAARGSPAKYVFVTRTDPGGPPVLVWGPYEQ